MQIAACDHTVEQLFPESTWGTKFVSVPLATRAGDTFRLIAGTDMTEVFLDGVSVATLDRGEVFQHTVEDPHVWEASHPVMLAQYSNSSGFDGVTSDPFMMLLPPVEQFLSSYTVSTPPSGISSNYLNIVVRTAASGSVKLDGAPVPGTSFKSVGASGYSVAQMPVSVGQHRLTGDEAFGVTSYGFDSYDSYGYPGGLSLAPIAFDDDGDGLPDDWEVNGVDYNNDGTIDLDLAAMGADANVPDIFIEVDYMETKACILWFCWTSKSFKPMQSALKDVVEAFEASPYGPIRMHIDAGPDSVMNPVTKEKWGSRSEANSVAHDEILGTFQDGEYNWSEFDQLQQFSLARREVFHYVLYADTYQGGVSEQCPTGRCSSGISRGIPGGALLVTDGSFDGFTRTQERGTFMHELGHNLNLYHGGGVNGNSNYDASYLSIMNYKYQLTGIGNTARLDYSSAAPYDDWLHLRYDGGLIGALGADDDPPMLTISDSLTYPEAIAMDALAKPGDGSVLFLGPQVVIPGTGDRTILFRIANPSSVAATFSLRVDSTLPVELPAPVRVDAGAETTVAVVVRSDSLTPGEYALIATLDSDLAGEGVSEVEGVVIAPDPTDPEFGQQLQQIQSQVGEIPADQLATEVRGLIEDQLADAVASDADNDGVSDAADNCPDTPAGKEVDSAGCPIASVEPVPSAPPVIDDPMTQSDAHYDVPADTDALDWTGNPDGSVTVTTKPGYIFEDETTSMTFPAPVDQYAARVCTGPISGGIKITVGGFVAAAGCMISGNIENLGDGNILLQMGSSVKGNIIDKGAGSVSIAVGSSVSGRVEEAGTGDVDVQGIVTGNVIEKGAGDVWVYGRISGSIVEEQAGSVYLQPGGLVRGNIQEKGDGSVVKNGGQVLGSIK